MDHFENVVAPALRAARLPVELTARLTDAARQIEFTGASDPIYPSPLSLAGGTASVLANIAVALDALRPGTASAGAARIDLGHALVTISSMWVLRVNGALAIETLSDPMTPGQGIYRCRDGRYLYLLSGFPHIVQRTLEALGCASAAELESFVGDHDSTALEARLVDAQLTGVIIRDIEEWRQHPQGKILADAPCVVIEKIADAPPAAMPSGPDAAPLADIRVLDATRVLAGPTCARTLAAFGADVLHVGSPDVPDMQAAQADTGHGKRRAFVDLATAHGRDTLWQLVDGADVFSQSYRADSLARRGLGVEAVAARRPGIVYVSENAYGAEGPWREKRGFDGNVQAASGIHLLHQKPTELAGSGPAMAMNDYCTGYWAAFGVLEALRRRATEGGSWHVKVSLGQTAAWFLRMGAPHDVGDTRPDIGYALAEQFSEEVDSDYGRLTRLKFPIAYQNFVPAWGTTVKPGTHDPVWLAR